MNAFTGKKREGIDPTAAMTYEEIAEKLGITTKTVRQTYRSAIIKLRKRQHRFVVILELAKLKGTGWV